jgi:hypothetical protein
MTTPSTPRKAGPLLGTGAQTSWPFTFKVFAASDIAVTIADTLGVETALVLGSDYSVTLNANQETSPGGTVTYPISGAALPVGKRLVIFGNLPYDQPLDLPSGGNFSPLALENQLDRLTMQIQQLREQVGRAIQVSVTTNANVGLPAPSANELIGWDSSGENLQNYALSELATAVAYATMRYDTFTGDGTETEFALTADPAVLANLDVAISGVTQVPGTDYSLVAGTLVFTSAPPNGAVILARYGEGLVNVSADSSDVRFLQAGTNAVQRTVQGKLRESVSVKDFGATGNGVVLNEQPFIQAAIDAVYAAGGGTVRIPAGTYKITAQIQLKPGVAFVGDGSGNTIIDHGTAAITAIATPAVTPTALTQTTDLLQGQISNTISNTCAAGDFINYRNTNLFTNRWANRVVRASYYEAELFDVASATSSSVTFTEGATINAPVASTLAVEFFTPNSGFKVQGITIRKSDAVINYSKGLYIQFAKNVVVDDLATENYDDSGYQITKSMYVQTTNTRHIGGSDSLGLCYGTTYIDGTKHCTHDGLIGRRCRHAFASGGTGYSLPMHITGVNFQITESYSHAVDCHADSAYFVISNVTADNGAAISGLGHILTNYVAVANSSNTMPYEGGRDIVMQNYTVQQRGGIANACSVYANERVVESTFENVNISAEYWNLVSFRSGSIVNVYKNWQLLCPPVSSAASSAAAEAFHTLDSRSIAGLMYQYNRMEGLTILGFVYGIFSAHSDNIIKDVWMQNCGWSGGTLTASVAASIYLTNCSRTRIENVNIDNDNANLTWNSRNFRIEPSAAMTELTIENVSNSLSPVGNVNYYNSFVTANVQQLFLKNIRTTWRGELGTFSAASGKYIYQTLTTDN